jgi:hypothetical protein
MMPGVCVEVRRCRLGWEARLVWARVPVTDDGEDALSLATDGGVPEWLWGWSRDRAMARIARRERRTVDRAARLAKVQRFPLGDVS